MSRAPVTHLFRKPKPDPRPILLRTDAGKVIDWFATVGAAKRHAETLTRTDPLVIVTRDGVVLARLFRTP